MKTLNRLFNIAKGTRTLKQNKQSGFEDAPDTISPCRHPNHNPPSHLLIPPGKQYRHICPLCRVETVITSNEPTLR